MKMTIELLIAAIVILIVALVVLTIFGTGIGQMSSITDLQNSCRNQAMSTCRATCELPVGWKEINYRLADGSTKTCADALSGKTTCNDFIGSACPAPGQK
jgi:sensor histidine kinase regulating citrate/malate metabolism